MDDKITGKVFFCISLVCAAFFSFLFLNADVLKWDAFIVGFLQELLTIPALLTVLILFALSVKLNYEQGFSLKSYLFWSSIILFIIIAATWGSFIFTFTMM